MQSHAGIVLLLSILSGGCAAPATTPPHGEAVREARMAQQIPAPTPVGAPVQAISGSRAEGAAKRYREQAPDTDAGSDTINIITQ